MAEDARRGFEAGEWLNEPADWSLADETLNVVTDHGSDFWRETHYGFVRDSGHFLGVEAPGDFTAELRVRGAFEALYDQAGLMVRLDPERWLKAGIEWTDGAANIGSVLTLGQSDWATSPYSGNPQDFRLRLTVSARRLAAAGVGGWRPLAAAAALSVSGGGKLSRRTDVLYPRTRRAEAALFRLLGWPSARQGSARSRLRPVGTNREARDT